MPPDSGLDPYSLWNGDIIKAYAVSSYEIAIITNVCQNATFFDVRSLTVKEESRIYDDRI